jgi:rhomboid family protein
MLEDRDYMRDRPLRTPWSTTKILTAVLIAVFALQCINDVYLHTPAEFWLALTPVCFRQGWLWQLITFQFLHATVWHLAFNLIVFWWVGHFVENVLGRRRYLVALFGCGAVGGILQASLMILAPQHYGNAVVGASAGVSGLFAIYAMLERESTVRLYFLLPVRAMTLLWAAGIVELFFTLVPTPREMGIAHAAHLGGLLAGVAWVKLGWHRDYVQLPWEGWLDRWHQWHPFRTRQRKRELVKAASLNSPRWTHARAEPPAELPEEEFISREVDPILDKISAHGIQSLTERERKILEAARSKMAKR